MIEKGTYHHESEFISDESIIGYKKLYENGGMSASNGRSLGFLAGSTFGGGTTVNWCASLKPQHFVREEWATRSYSLYFSQCNYLNSPCLLYAEDGELKIDPVLLFCSSLKISIEFMNVLVQLPRG